MKRPELMAPAGDRVSLIAALKAGADSVYFGLKDLNMRATAGNFELNQLKEIISLCRKSAAKAYLTINTILYEEELDKLKKTIKAVSDAGVDGIIFWDMAVLRLAAEHPKLKLILSTQASVSNSIACTWYKKQGISRIVLARECSLEQIRTIRKKTDIEIEVFVHGAMCVSVSGRCFLSQFLFGRSANRGDCLQPCRRHYKVIDPEENKELDLMNNYVMSPKDLCTLPFIEKLIEAGITCFKIEGRARSPEYVRTVTAAYKKAIDAYFAGTLDQQLKDQLTASLKTVFNRGFSGGFFLGRPIDDWTDAYGSQATTRKHYIGYVRKFYKKISVAELVIESGEVMIGDMIMFQGPVTGVNEQEVISLQKEHQDITKASKGERIALKADQEARPRDKVFKILHKDLT